MANKLTFMNFQGEILNKKPDNFEVAGLNDKDIMFIKAFAIEEGLNANNALFEKDDLQKAVPTFTGKPLKIRFINNDPTGHGYNRTTGEFDELVKPIGYIYDAWGGYFDEEGGWSSEEEGGTYKVIVYMAMWQKYYPEIATRLRQLHTQNDLKFSIEAERDFDMTDEGYRRCFNITFNGLAVVKTPAFDNARSLMVAELLNNKEGGQKMDFEKLYNDEKAKTENLSNKLALAEKNLEVAESDRESFKSEVAELKTELAEKDGTIKTITAERDTFKAKIETAEKSKLGQSRHDKLTKYGDVAKTTEELAEMTTEEFAELMIEVVESFDPSSTENAEKKDEVIGVNHENNKSENASRKDSLLKFIEGLD